MKMGERELTSGVNFAMEVKTNRCETNGAKKKSWFND
jgi:hypothetical protein